MLTGGHAPPFDNTQQQFKTVHAEERGTQDRLARRSGFQLVVAGVFYSDTKVDELYTRDLAAGGARRSTWCPTPKTYDALRAARPGSSLRPPRWSRGCASIMIVISYQYNQSITAPACHRPYYSTGAAIRNKRWSATSASSSSSADNVMGYVSYSRGYSPAAYNTSAVLTSDATLPPVAGRTINSYRDRHQGHLPGPHADPERRHVRHHLYRTIRFRAIAYAARRDSPRRLILTSAGKAETRGAEFSGDWLATPTTQAQSERRLHRCQVRHLYRRALLRTADRG